MKPEMRDVLARQSFEEKIRKVAQLILLSRKVAAQGVREKTEKIRNPQSVEATANRTDRNPASETGRS